MVVGADDGRSGWKVRRVRNRCYRGRGGGGLFVEECLDRSFPLSGAGGVDRQGSMIEDTSIKIAGEIVIGRCSRRPLSWIDRLAARHRGVDMATLGGS